MIYKRIKPSPSLSDIVESIWLQDNSNAEVNLTPSRIVPTGTVEILFYYRNRITHLEKSEVIPMPRSYVTGQRRKPILAVVADRVGIVIVSLYPWGLSPLFRESIEAPDCILDLRLIVDECRISELEEKLFLASNSEQRVCLVESFIINHRANRKFDKRIAIASQLLVQNGSALSVSEIARRLSLSERHLSRLFMSEIGLSPKMFSRIMRFQRAVQLRRRHEMPWAAVATECGYSDQAHLIHEIRHFSGKSPGKIEFHLSKHDDTFNGEGASRFFDTVYM